MREINTYKAFWPFYVSQHQNKVSRNFHFVGSTFVLGCLVAGFLKSPWYFLAIPFCGYGFAWFGHLVFERNRPATFTYPLWSLQADFQMFAFMCLGRMDREVKRMGVLQAGSP
jgi:hypothetical protein